MALVVFETLDEMVKERIWKRVMEAEKSGIMVLLLLPDLMGNTACNVLPSSCSCR